MDKLCFSTISVPMWILPASPVWYPFFGFKFINVTWNVLETLFYSLFDHVKKLEYERDSFLKTHLIAVEEGGF